MGARSFYRTPFHSAASARPGTKIRILIGNHPPILREGLRAILEREPDFDVVGIADGDDELIELASLLRPDILMIDAAQAGGTGLELARKLRKADPEVVSHVIVIGKPLDADTVIDLIQAGLRGFIEENVCCDVLPVKIRQFAAGVPIARRPRCPFYSTGACGRNDLAGQPSIVSYPGSAVRSSGYSP